MCKLLAYFPGLSKYTNIAGKKNECFCDPDVFDYPEGKENILIGKIGENNKFTVKRIIVIQMEEIDGIKLKQNDR